MQTVTSSFAADTPRCAVPRNDPTVQPLQPSPNQVEWAVDNAVHGTLTVPRPANYLKAGLPSYQAQEPGGWFKPRNPESPAIPAEYRAVPAQVMLGIVAQETNMSQASWHEVPGDTGNPLVAGYYGSAANDVIDYSKSDWGYGISQVTTGMAVDDRSVYDTAERQAIAVDYVANIAAGLNILIDKWNQLHDEPAGATDTMNDDDPNWIENWFTALWAYNSGLHAYADRNSPDSGGYYGLGRLDNPANPNYPANRDGFLRDSYADAATPSHWSYPERIMGWIETPQLKSAPGYNGPAYHEPAYGENSPSAARGSLNLPLPVLNLPSIWAFCDAASGCSRAAGGCPAYHIIAHMPSHGGNWSSAVYNVQRGNQDAINGTPVYAYVSSCSIDQDPSTGDFGSDHWVDIGSYQLEPGAQVVLNNDAAPATADVGYDAMAFVPVTRQPGKGSCGTVYN